MKVDNNLFVLMVRDKESCLSIKIANIIPGVVFSIDMEAPVKNVEGLMVQKFMTRFYTAIYALHLKFVLCDHQI
jgi:hypothetical protein